MKTVFVFFISVLSLSFAQAQPSDNPYAPKMTDVVALYDVADREFSPLLFHSLMGENFDMLMDSTCESIQVVDQKMVMCLSKKGATPVGTLGAQRQRDPQNGFMVAYSINWFANVEIKEILHKYGAVYSVHVK